MRASLDWLFHLPEEEPADYRNWRPWFAWRPKIIDRKLVWFEWVERRPVGLYPPTFVFPCDYRLPPAIRSRNMRTRRDDQQFLFGIMAGIALVIVSMIIVSELTGIKWLPVQKGRVYLPNGQVIVLPDK